VRKVPAEGEVVLVRGSYWAVSDVKAQGLPRSSADESSGIQHLVTLSSVAEDRLGVELRVIWELEVGASVIPDIGLPELKSGQIDNPELFAAFLDSLRWGAITSADNRTLQAPYRSGVSVEPYQLEPVVRAINNSRANMLLADDVGLGKTIEAGLVVQELLLRHRARTVCIVCPAGLAIKWQIEMRDKFGLDFKIINSDMMKDVRRTHGVHVNPFSLFPRVIVSMQWLPGDRASRLLDEIYERVNQDRLSRARAFDILIVDEAHHVAPSSPSNATKGKKTYAVDSQRTKAVRRLAENCEHRLFLTATPHNGYTESFTALLEMVDNRRFVRGANFDRKNLAEVVVRRLKKTLTELGVKSFPPRRVKSLQFEPSESEILAYIKLEEFLKRRNTVLKGSRAGDMSTLLLKKRFLSSPISFAHTVNKFLTTQGGIIDDAEEYDEVLGNNSDDLEEGLSDQTEFLALQANNSGAPVLTSEDKTDLKWLAEWGLGYQGSKDSRLSSLIEELNAVVRPDMQSGSYTNERVVIFTEYVDTLNWIYENLLSHGFDQERLAIIKGDTDSETREVIKAQFQENPSNEPVRILLATDAAGEGIDLQNHCHRLINYDIPFNPNKLEQRAGRIDRYGQKYDPEIYHFVPTPDAKESGYKGDYEMLDRIARKVVTQEQDLGPGNQLISEEIQEKLVRNHSVKQEKRKKNDFLVTEILAGEKEVGKELTKLEETLQANRENLHANPANVFRVVNQALLLDHQPSLREIGDQDSSSPLYEVPGLSQSWELTVQNLYGINHRNVRRPITFDGEVLGDRTDVVFVHLGHQFVQRASQLLRSALWRGKSQINRATAVVIPDLEESIVAAVCRIVLIGRGGIRLHEDVFLAGTRLKGGQILGEDRSEKILESALDGSNFQTVSLGTLESLVEMWSDDTKTNSLRSKVNTAIEKRQEKLLTETSRLLEKRKAQDLSRVKEIFDRFEALLKASLKQAHDEGETYLEQLFDEGKQQRLADIKRWTDRLTMLSEERAREIENVEKRFQDVKPFVMPAALIFALNPKDDV